MLAVIVAILASLSIPTLSSQRRLAMAASCQGNLKELQVGVLLYAMESDDFLPPVEYVPGSDEAFHGQPEAYGWFTINPLVVPFPQTWGEWQAARNAKQGERAPLSSSAPSALPKDTPAPRSATRPPPPPDGPGGSTRKPPWLHKLPPWPGDAGAKSKTPKKP